MSCSILVHLPCAGPARLPLLWSSLSSLCCDLAKPKHTLDVTVSVSWNSHSLDLLEVNDGQGLKTWEAAFASVGAKFELVFRPGLSVAQMYAEALGAKGYDYVVKVDDDCLFTNFDDYLAFVSENRADFVSSNFWDVENFRGYDDWRPTVSSVEEREALVAEFGERTLWCHRHTYAQPSNYCCYRADTACNCSVFAVRLAAVQNDLRDKLYNIAVGQRGMDKVVGNHFSDRLHHLSSYATHLGIYRPQLDGTYWKSYAEGCEIKHSKL